MAINVNTVYTTVLSILNKEQRGYLTPYEFNQAATQAQLSIFENYFEDLNQQLRIPQTNFDYSNRIVNLDDEISTFRCLGDCSYSSSLFNLPTTDDLTGKSIVYNDSPGPGQFAFYRLGTPTYHNTTTVQKKIEIERLQRNAFYNIDKSDLTAPSENFPVYLYENQKLSVKPTDIIENVSTSFIRKPLDVRWGYTVGSLGQYIYDSSIYPVAGNNALKVGEDLMQNNSISGGIADMTSANGTVTAPSTVVGEVVSVTGSGSGAVLSFTTNFVPGTTPGAIQSLVIVQPGSGYAIGDTIKLNPEPTDSFFGGFQSMSFVLQSSNFQATQTTSGSTNFEISNNKQTEVILEILKTSGVIIRDPQIVQAAAQELAEDENNSKR